ncbi:AP-3 complex subunit delta-1 [Rhizophlyctis rosea]|nr:AP-3 complex subunit delta-1 [Rhizophlyctis rosea]
MSSPKIEYKRIGYRAAAVSFRQDTDVLMLCTNLIKKDLSSNNFLEASAALNALAQIVTPDLARDLCPDLISMLNHSRPYIRKRVILVLYKLFLKYPEALRLAFPRLKEKLSDPDPSVVSAAVNVVCELARKNPKSYLPLAPQLYGLLTNSTNNWMLIKIIKLFAALTPLEPRLTKKLISPITTLIQNTPAMSLLYECIQTVITGNMIGPETENGENEETDSALARLCVSKLKLFIEEPDQNLKYLGLLALSKLLAVRPKAVIEHKDMILQCLDDADVSIRMRALELVTGVVNQRNLVDIVRRLMAQILPARAEATSDARASYPPPTATGPSADPIYRQEVISRIISMCSRDTYANVINFEWYMTVLIDLVSVTGVNVGHALTGQIVDVCVRVKNVREFAVKAMIRLLGNEALLYSATQEKTNSGVLYGAAWIVGEYVSMLPSPVDVLQLLLKAGAGRLSPIIQAVYIQNILKIYTFWANFDVVRHSSGESFGTVSQLVIDGLQRFVTSPDLEVQERACMASEILTLIPLSPASSSSIGPDAYQSLDAESGKEDQFTVPPIIAELSTLFNGELNPVAPKAQKKVPVPEGLNLDAWIHEPEPEVVQEEEADEDYGEFGGGSGYGNEGKRREYVEDPADAARRRREQAERRRNDPFYIPSHESGSEYAGSAHDDVDSIPIMHLKIDGGLPPLQAGKQAMKGKKTKKGKKRVTPREPSPPPVPTVSYEINRGSEMPEGAADVDSDEEDRRQKQIDPDTMAVMSVDLTVNPEDDIPVAPAPVEAPRLELSVQRKKIPKKKEKEADKDGDQLKVKKKKKKKAEEGAGAESLEGGDKKKKKKKKAEIAATDTSSPAVSLPSTPPRSHQTPPIRTPAPLTVPEGEAAYERIRSPAPVQANLDVPVPVPMQKPLEINNEVDVVGIADDDVLSVGFKWQVITEGTSETMFSIGITLVIDVSGDGPVTKAKLEVTGTGLMRVEEGTLEVDGPIDVGTPSEAINFVAVLPLENPHLMVPPTIVEGLLTYQLKKDIKTIPLAIPLPSSVNLQPPNTSSIDPETFTNLLTDANNFPFSASTQFSVPSAAVTAEALPDTIAALARRTRLVIVELVAGAASVFGRSRQGWYVAGLVKVKSGGAGGRGRGKGAAERSFLSVELKSGSRGLIDGLVEEIGEWGAEL